MNLAWLRHLLFSLIVTVSCLAACLCVILALRMKFPVGLDDALALAGIAFAAMLSVFIYMPQNLWAEMASARGLRRAFWWWLICSMVIAAAGSMGGGILRRWIIGQATVLRQPLDPWWYAVSCGWLFGFAFCFVGANLYKRFNVFAKAFDEIDAWVMGAFAAAGAFAAIPWQPFGAYSDNPLVKLALAALFAGLTGAGGGLVARLFSLVTLNFAPGTIATHASEWFLKLYVSLAMACGVTIVPVLVFVQALLSPRHVEYKEFAERSMGSEQLLHAGTYLDGTFLKVSTDLLLFTDLGNKLALSLIAAAMTCYVFRLAAPYFAIEAARAPK